MQVELQESGNALPTVLTDVAMFKEAVPAPRVVADSSKFIVYSLKNPGSLRVLARSNNAQGTFKAHKSDIQIAKFVNHKSNVIATSATNEFFVWFITVDDGNVETKLYLSLTDKVTIRSFCWFLDTKSETPELLILYGTTAAQLQSSKLITGYGTVAPEVALSDYALPFDRQVGTDAAFTAVGADGMFAFSTDAVSVAVCTARHGNAPAFRACDGEPIIGLEVLQEKPAVLVAACTSFASVWSIDGEPTKLYKLTVGAPILIALSTQNTIALFNNNKEAFLIDIANKKIQQHTRHQLSFQVPSTPRSVSLNATENGFASLCDFSSRLSFHTLKRPGQPVAAASPKAPAPAVAAAAVPFVDPAVLSASAAVPVSKQRAPAPSNTSPQMPPPYVPVAPAALPRTTLVNTSLPQVSQDGQIAQAMDMCQSEILELKQRLDSAVQNTAQIVQLVPQMVKRDHVSLLTLSLEAQITELQNAVKAGEIGSSAGGAAGPTGFESQLLATLMDDVAHRLVEGLVPGIRDALLGDLEPTLRSAVVNHLKKTQKDVFKTRVDAVLKNVAGEFAAELERKQRLYEKQFENYGKEVRRVTEGALTKLLQQVSSLEDQLAAITGSGILEEVKELRAEVQSLRAAAASGAVAESNVAPATIVATAKAMIENRDAERGLEYVARVNVKEATIELLEELGREESLRDVALQVNNDKLWEQILFQLASSTRSGELPVVLQWVKDIVTDHEGAIASIAMRKALATFIGTWKQSSNVDPLMQKELRIVEKLVR